MNRKGFTLIELLAVIIILGILLLIAIPGVTGYINNSRKNIYVDTAKELIKGTSKLLNSGDFDTLEEGVTYYMDSRCIANESGKEAQSPFGKFNPAYVLVVNEDDNYNYYFQSRDETEVGVKDITSMDSLEISKIVSNVKEEDIDTTVGIGSTTKTAVIDQNCNVGEAQPASRRVSKDGEKMVTLTFDNQGGTGCDMQSQYYGEEWGKLCKPKKEGWKFVGWYTKANKLGDKITKTTKAEKSMTVYAAWTDQFAIFDTGIKVSAKIKKLSGQVGASYNSTNNNIKYIKVSNEEPIEDNKQETNIVSSSTSAIPIYAWFDTDTIYIWSEDEEPYLNSNPSYMFSANKILESIDGLDKFDTSFSTDFSWLFSNCVKLTSLDLSNLDTSNVTTMSYMFYDCDKLYNLDLSNFDTSNVVSFSSMFYQCSNIREIEISNWNTSKTKSMYAMFGLCSMLQVVDVSNFDTSNVTNMESMFNNCHSLLIIDVSGFNTSNVLYMERMFFACMAITQLNVSNFDTSNVIEMEAMFDSCTKITTLNVSNFDTSKVTSFGYIFNDCEKLISIDLSTWNSSQVTGMSQMFKYCSNLETIIENFDTSNVTTMEEMFYDCEKLTSINISNWNTSNVTTMKCTFYSCSSLTSLNVSNFDTSNVTNFDSMFRGCSKIIIIDVSNFDTSKATKMTSMFERCSLITSLDLSNFDTSNVTDISYFFNRCIGLESIDISSFDLSHASWVYGLFYECNNLKTIYVDATINLSNSTSYYGIFKNCSSLVGGAGTHWNSSMEGDITKAIIDGGIDSPGLFTLKTA